MKKLLSLVLILALCMGLGLTFTGCGDKEPYSNYDLSEYITLPDYNKYSVKEPVVEITDKEIDEQITKNLEAAATTETVKEGTVAKGDTVTVAFDGTLEDGTKADGMSSEGSKLTLGAGQYIAGFEEGLYGATIGEEVTLDLKFPDPYTNNEKLSGKGVTFKVTVLSKEVKILPELNDEFVKKTSESKTVAEYRAAVAKALEQKEFDDQLYDIKFEVYSKIVEKTEIAKYPDKELKANAKEIKETYKAQAEAAGLSFEEFIDKEMKLTEADFDAKAKEYAQEVVKQEMIIYAIAEKEGLTVTDEEYDKYLDSLLSGSGFKSEDDFKAYTGMSLEEYAEAYKLDRDLLLTKALDLIYDRLLEAQTADK